MTALLITAFGFKTTFHINVSEVFGSDEKRKCELSRVSLTLGDPMDCSPPGFLCPWDFPSKNPGVGCHFPLQGCLPIQGSNLKSPALAGGFFTTEPPG